MSKLYYGDAVIRLRNAGFNPVTALDSKGKSAGISVGKVTLYSDSVGLFSADEVDNFIKNGKISND